MVPFLTGKCRPKAMLCAIYLFVAVMAVSYRTILIRLHDQLDFPTELRSDLGVPKTGGTYPPPTASSRKQSTCAILLFGLPRAFKDYVLPSLEKNVITPNAQYGCDYFVHYYKQDNEASSRSGMGGAIRSEDVFLLEASVANIHQAHTGNDWSSDFTPTVTFRSDTNETFWEKRWPSIQHYRTAKNEDGRYRFFPYNEPTYEYPTTLDNIVRQWHSINAVWDAMEEASSSNRNHYRRVAMMRNDVVYITPIDIYDVPDGANATANLRTNDYTTNRASVIPNFANYPVNDRLIYGPHSAVKVWASQRFAKMEDYAHQGTPGMVLHSETFLNASILQAIDLVVQDPWMCFLRVRADGAIWLEDCDPSKSGFGGGYPGGKRAYKKLLNEFLPNRGRGCKRRRLRDKLRLIYELVCPKKE